MNNVKFSVIIPLYNKSNHIKRAIDSVLQQNYQNYEIIVINDGSTDNSPNIVRQYNNDNIKLINQKNQGVSSARNLGIKFSNYKYIAFLDADDAWKQNYLKNILYLINNNRKRKIFATSYLKIDNNNKIIKPKFKTISKNQIQIIENYFYISLNNNLLTSSSIVINKDIFQSIGFFDERLERGEDLDLWFRIALKYNIVFLNKPCVIYYKNSNNRASNKQKKKKQTEIFLKNIQNYTKQIHFNKKSDINKYINKFLINDSKFFILNGKKKYGRQLIKRCDRKYFLLYQMKWYCLSFFPSKIIQVLKKAVDFIKLSFF